MSRQHTPEKAKRFNGVYAHLISRPTPPVGLLLARLISLLLRPTFHYFASFVFGPKSNLAPDYGEWHAHFIFYCIISIWLAHFFLFYFFGWPFNYSIRRCDERLITQKNTQTQFWLHNNNKNCIYSLFFCLFVLWFRFYDFRNFMFITFLIAGFRLIATLHKSVERERGKQITFHSEGRQQCSENAINSQ